MNKLTQFLTPALLLVIAVLLTLILRRMPPSMGEWIKTSGQSVADATEFEERMPVVRILPAPQRMRPAGE